MEGHEDFLCVRQGINDNIDHRGRGEETYVARNEVCLSREARFLDVFNVNARTFLSGAVTDKVELAGVGGKSLSEMLNKTYSFDLLTVALLQ